MKWITALTLMTAGLIIALAPSGSNGGATERLAGKDLADKIFKCPNQADTSDCEAKSNTLNCYVCTDCSDPKVTLSEADVKPCKGAAVTKDRVNTLIPQYEIDHAKDDKITMSPEVKKSYKEQGETYGYYFPMCKIVYSKAGIIARDCLKDFIEGTRPGLEECGNKISFDVGDGTKECFCKTEKCNNNGAADGKPPAIVVIPTFILICLSFYIKL